MFSKILTLIQNFYNLRHWFLPFNDIFFFFFQIPGLNIHCLLGGDSFNKYNMPRQLLLGQLEAHSIRIRSFLIRKLLYCRSTLKFKQMTLPHKIFKKTYSGKRFNKISIILLFYEGCSSAAWALYFLKVSDSEEKSDIGGVPCHRPNSCSGPNHFTHNCFCSVMFKRKMFS